MHHDVQDLWLSMLGTGHAFHVINATLFRSRGTSAANSSSPPSSSKMSSPRFARFREDSNMWRSCQFPPKTTTKGQFPKKHVLCQNLLLQHLPAEPGNDTNVPTVPHSTRLCLSASASRPNFLSFQSIKEDEARGKAS